MQIDEIRLLGLGGSNKLMAGEVSRLVRRAFDQQLSREIISSAPRKLGPGGLSFPYRPELAEVITEYHRTGARALWALASLRSTRLEPLYDELLEDLMQDQRPWQEQDFRFSVLAFHTDATEAGERQVVGVVKNALLAAATQKGRNWQLDPERPDVVFQIRGEKSEEDPRLVFSVDLAGRALHERGYRIWSGDAPLREDRAAQLVMLSR
ncbi:MAG: hypothetical protein MK135_16780, partial [Polyangiaceae bacterium]|nr:hypothetical protein [Polyangiaceae bacterium]